MGFVLPADLERAGRPARHGATGIQQRQAVGHDRAGHLDDEFMFDAGGILDQFSGDAPVLGPDHQAAGAIGQRRGQRQTRDVALQKTDAGAIVGRDRLRPDQPERGALCGRSIDTHRFVQQDRHGWLRRQRRVRRQRHGLPVQPETRFFDHFAIDADPAALDVQFRFSARAADEFSKMFGKADGVGHRLSAIVATNGIKVCNGIRVLTTGTAEATRRCAATQAAGSAMRLSRCP